jgi:SAM-dependent methyltransferase
VARPVFEPEDALPFWEQRYAAGPVYGFDPTSLAPRLAALFRAHGVRALLDAGCGSGRDALYYAGQGFDVTGVDLSRNALRWAADRARALGLTATFLQDDLTESRLASESFDGCVAVHLLHLHPAHLRRQLVGQLWRTARDGGILAMANYSTREAGFQAWEPHLEPNTRIDPKGKLVHFFAAEDFDELLPPARFKILALEEFELAEVPESGPTTHREWLVVAQKIRAC